MVIGLSVLAVSSSDLNVESVSDCLEGLLVLTEVREVDVD